jgi:hypothetical protein
MRSLPPNHVRRSLLAAIALAIALAGCGAPHRSPAPSEPSSPDPSHELSPEPSPGLGGLLVVANGRIRETADDGSLGPFDAPDEAVQATVASPDRVLVVGADGRTWVSTGTGSGRTWAALPASVTAPGIAPLIALSPGGTLLAAARGHPQAARFDLDLVEIPSGTARRLVVPRGLNGPPAWLASSTVVLDVIPAGGSSGLAAIDVGTGAVKDSVGPGIEVAVSADASWVAVIDDGGDVLVGDGRQWRAGRIEMLVHLRDIGSVPGSTAERLAISGDGRRVAIVRRHADDAADVEIWLRDGGSWSRATLLEHLTSGPVSIAWMR